MLKRKSLGLFLVVSLLTGNVAQASFSDGLIGGVVGGVVGSVITNEVYHKKRHKKRRVKKHRAKKKHVKKHVKRYVAPKPKIVTPEMKIQKTLAALGFYRGNIDGEVNSYETRSAIKAMNIAYELGDTASLAPRSRDALIYLGDLFTFDRILIAKDNGKRAKAKKIQASLKIHGFYHNKIDGAIGSGTRMNISEYKMAKGLSGGTSFDFEEEYQLISSAKQVNDKNMDDAIASLKGIPARNQPSYVNTHINNTGIVLPRQNVAPAQQQHMMRQRVQVQQPQQIQVQQKQVPQQQRMQVQQQQQTAPVQNTIPVNQNTNVPARQMANAMVEASN